MKVYIATAFSMWRNAQAARSLLEESGHEVTSRWIDVAASYDGKEPPGLSKAERRDHALGDLEDLDEADVLLLIVPPEGGTGCWWEVGHARRGGQAVIAVGDICGRTIFGELVVSVDVVVDALPLLECMTNG